MEKKLEYWPLFCLLVLFVLPSLCLARDTYVKGYYRSDGTYVQPYHRSSPDNNRMNNYSYPNNYNPYTGQQAPNSNNPKETWPSNPNPYKNWDLGDD